VNRVERPERIEQVEAPRESQRIEVPRHLARSEASAQRLLDLTVRPTGLLAVPGTTRCAGDSRSIPALARTGYRLSNLRVSRGST
jgi:hypothetical protein